MGCPGGCVAGAGTNIPVVKAQIQVKKFVEEAEDFVPPETAQYEEDKRKGKCTGDKYISLFHGGTSVF